MNIAGSGVVPAGDYNEIISTAGSAEIRGSIRCPELHCAGSVRAEGNIECSGIMETAGSFRTAGSVSSGKTIQTAGSVIVEGSVKCETLKASGSFHVGEEIEAESVTISGSVLCGGLINAEKIDIKFSEGCHVGSVGGGTITLITENGKASKKPKIRLPLFSKLTGSGVSSGTFTVDESIEGDTIAIENVSAPLVTGRVVAIGAGCVIGTVRYSEEIEISPDAKVEKTEKEE